MGHAYGHWELKNTSKINGLGEKKMQVSGLDIFLQRFCSRVGSSWWQQRTDTVLVSWNNIYAKSDSDIAISVTNVKTNRNSFNSKHM